MSDTREPIQHNYQCAQFKCICGEITTFSPNSVCYKPLNDLHSPGPRMMAGYCPYCGVKHWYGTTRAPKAVPR